MKTFDKFEILPGSDRRALNAREVGETAPDTLITVTMHLRRKEPLNVQAIAKSKRFLSHRQLEDRHGASLEDVEIVREFARHFGLTVLDANLRSRSIVVKGTAACMAAAFKVKLVDRRHGSNTFRTRVGHLYLPTELEGVVTGVFGLDNRPQAFPHFRLSSRPFAARGSKPDAFDGNSLSKVYGIPESTGTGQIIALIELGGGYNAADMDMYFSALGLPIPAIKAVSVSGGKNSPGIDEDADIEVALDIQVTGSVAPQASIAVYFAPNTDAGFLQAVQAAIHDAVTLISISWGSAELTWTSSGMITMNQAFQDANALGISIFVAAGDDGVDDNVGNGKVNVDFPASSPSVTACGGTSLIVVNGVRQETVWNDGDGSASGGGISNFFARPSYQINVVMPANLNGNFQGRGLPDVAAVADPDTGYAVYADGSWLVVGGTSAVAPFFAGITARLNQLRTKPVGLINASIYQNPNIDAFNDITAGNNSSDGIQGYSAAVGWDPVTGFGSPNGGSLFKLFNA